MPESKAMVAARRPPDPRRRGAPRRGVVATVAVALGLVLLVGLSLSGATPFGPSPEPPEPPDHAAPGVEPAPPYPTGAPQGSGKVSDRPAPSVGFDSHVLGVAYHRNVIYVVGRFQAARDGDRTVRRERVAAIDAATGRLRGWAPRADGAVETVVVAGGSAYLGGHFSHVNGEPRHGLAKLDLKTGKLDPEFAPAVSGRVLRLAVGHGRLYVGGAFDQIEGQRRHNLGAVSLDGGEVLGWRPRVNGSVRSIVADTRQVYVGGGFTEVNGSREHQMLAALSPYTGAVRAGFRPAAEDLVRDMALGAEGLYVAAGGDGGRLISYDRKGRVRWVATANGDMQAVAVLGRTVYAGGHFNKICHSARVTRGNGDCLDGSTTRRKLASYSTSGVLREWAPQADSSVGVHSLAANPELGAIAVGGEFVTFDLGDISQPYFAYFH
ncbi:MAG: PQQ-binding-like beta-propeller repeat protein [Micromonosporaceae bacterium]